MKISSVSYNYNHKLGINRYYNPHISRFYATYPLAEKYPNFSPYTYTADNSVVLADPNGKKVRIIGKLKRLAFKLLQFSVIRNGLKLKIDKKGNLSYKITDKAKLNKGAKELIKAIDDKGVLVNIKTIGNNLFRGSFIFAGAFFGNKIIKKGIRFGLFIVGTKVVTTQVVNPNDIDSMDSSYANRGQSMLHEVIESYLGGRFTAITGIQLSSSSNNFEIYKQLHSLSPPQSGDVFSEYYSKEGERTNDISKAMKIIIYTFDPLRSKYIRIKTIKF